MERPGRRQTGSLFLSAQHQLRQPLNAISLLIGELRDATEGRDRAAIIEDMRYALQLSNAWLDSLTDLEKAEQGLLQPHFQNVPLHQVFARLRDDFAGHFADLGLEFRIVDSDAVVRGDVAILRRIITLLLDNAAKFTRHGKVLLGCRRRGARLRIEVRDSGLGLSAAEQDRLFEAFYRLENEVRPHERGLGLGLTYARRLAESIAADLTLTSEKDRGSCFALTLDMAERPNAQEAGGDPANDAAAPPSALPADPLAGAKVLILAGEEAATLRGSFENWGARVRLATQETLAEALCETPDLLLADPAVLGTGDIRSLLQEAGGSTVLILLTDPSASKGDRQPSAADRTHILERPIRPARLRSLSHYALTHR